MGKINKKYGFTLTELMIAMAVVGVIAALVVPGIVRNFNRSGFEKTLGSFYGDLSQSMSIAYAENGDLARSPFATGSGGALVKNYMQAMRDPSCLGSRTPCFAASYSSNNLTNTTTSAEFCTTGKTFLLQSGMAICITPMTTDAALVKDNYAEVFVDLNGPELPNIAGKDLFRMNIYSDGTVDEQIPPSHRDGSNEPSAERATLAAKCLSSATGEGCFTRFMSDGMKIQYYE